ncbi:MAG: phosphate/phosphite/phosphonate ABC transporter substrate-binding protein [Thermodesulfovibrionia bacterium]
MCLGCVQGETSKEVNINKREDVDSQSYKDGLGDTIWFGFDLRLDPREDVRIYTPFLGYLERATGRHFKIRFSPTYEETIDALGRGDTQFAAIGTVSYVIGRERYGIRYLVSGLNSDGIPRYRAMIVVRPKSGISSIRDLKGRAFCFGSDMSTQGHLIPRKMLEDEGIMLKDLSYHIYTGSHANAVTSLLNGECDAAGIQDTLARRLESEGKIRILKVSEPYPSSIIAYNKDVKPEIVKAVESALLAFEPMGRHKDTLYKWDVTEMPLGFTKVDESEMDKVERLARRYGLLKR